MRVHRFSQFNTPISITTDPIVLICSYEYEIGINCILRMTNHVLQRSRAFSQVYVIPRNVPIILNIANDTDLVDKIISRLSSGMALYHSGTLRANVIACNGVIL